MTFVPEELAGVANNLRGGHEARSESVRAFLGWFGAERRGAYVVRVIREALAQVGVQTDPDFETAFLDGSLRFCLARENQGSLVRPIASPATLATPLPGLEGSPPSAPRHEAQSAASSAFADPTYRIGKLASANRPPIGVPPDCTVREATTLMLTNDFSQLPVWQTERALKGVVSWASIGARLVLGQASKIVRECMDPAFEISSDDSLFAVINLIVEHEYALVRSTDARIVGIVTTADLSIVFQQLSEPFLLLGETENHIRRLLDGKFTAAELEAERDPTIGVHSVTGVADLTFGEYLRLLEKPQNWDRLALGLDRSVFTKELDRVRGIRNDVMHFDPDGIGDEDLRILRRFVKFLRSLRSMGAT